MFELNQNLFQEPKADPFGVDTKTAAKRFSIFTKKLADKDKLHSITLDRRVFKLNLTGNFAMFSQPIQLPPPSFDSKKKEAEQKVLLMNAKDTAKKLSVCEKTIRRLAAKGEIQKVKVARCTRYTVESVHEYIRRQQSTK